jgi:hypothetical protein
MKKINLENKKLSEAIISDERTLKKFKKSSDRRSSHQRSEISFYRKSTSFDFARFSRFGQIF